MSRDNRGGNFLVETPGQFSVAINTVTDLSVFSRLESAHPERLGHSSATPWSGSRARASSSSVKGGLCYSIIGPPILIEDVSLDGIAAD